MGEKNIGVEKSSQREASQFVVFKGYYQNDQINEDEMGKTGTDEKVIQTDHLGESIDGRIILQWMFNTIWGYGLAQNGGQ
jgi:hypothetical protein